MINVCDIVLEEFLVFRGKTLFISADFADVFVSYVAYFWIVLIGLCFWLICILVIKNLSVWMLTSCTKYQVFVSFFLVQWYNFSKSYCSRVPPSSA